LLGFPENIYAEENVFAAMSKCRSTCANWEFQSHNGHSRTAYWMRSLGLSKWWRWHQFCPRGTCNWELLTLTQTKMDRLSG
jgi:hypothetical protein